MPISKEKVNARPAPLPGLAAEDGDSAAEAAVKVSPDLSTTILLH